MAGKKYTNYDFGRKWEKEIVPHLSDPELEDVIKLIKSHPRHKDRKFWNDAPVELAIGDGFCRLTMEIVEYDLDHPERLTTRERTLLKAQERLEPEDGIWENEKDERMCWKYSTQLESSILSRYGLRWRRKSNTHIAFYIPFGECFLWNRYFGLWLAKKVCPEVDWKVEESGLHCTVICHKTKRVFDILYWGIDDRLEDYCLYKCGRTETLKYSHSDPTLGGKTAYESTRVKRRV
jgi:hypothetical protein